MPCSLNRSSLELPEPTTLSAPALRARDPRQESIPPKFSVEGFQDLVRLGCEGACRLDLGLI